MSVKYVVTLHKVIEKKVVVEVESEDLEAVDKKLTKNDVVAEVENVVSRDDYNGWEYRGGVYAPVAISPTEALICNLEDFARWYGCETVDELERALFDNTECGMCYSATTSALTLIGVVEGADCDGPSVALRYPFTGKEAKDTIEWLDTRAAKMWREWNCPEEESETEENSYFGIPFGPDGDPIF